ncbi:MAG: DUF1549 and DUF1553 domain-containing protein [Planctomycetaceae bacterium]
MVALAAAACSRAASAADVAARAAASEALWSLEPLALSEPPPPPPEHADWPRDGIDRFILARLSIDGIPPPPPAVARTLARRLFFDLHGLPPTPDDVERFVAATDAAGPDAAAAALVDDLLASPRFGEHLARLWLDVVRYADSNGFDWDEFRPQAWRFRDYVVRSFNADTPFDRFLREQLAGDELSGGPPDTPADRDAWIATGYLRLGPHDNAAGLFNEQARSRAELLADLTETTAGAFLGLTFSCCRCHDHKTDPFSQADHYRLRAFFAAVRFADDAPLDLRAEREAIAAHNEARDAEAAALRRELEALGETDAAAREALAARIAAVEGAKRPFTRGMLMTDEAGTIPPTHVLAGGDHAAPLEEVEPGFPAVFAAGPAAIAAPADPRTSGRRRALADWIASPRHPLTARVFVNRIWQALHGRALVATPDDFGHAGSPPADRALLDHLAETFVRDGWSVKRLVRRVVLSATYRQAPAGMSDHFVLRPPRRLSAEQIRDAMLHVSGLLDGKRDGAPVWPELPAEVLDSNPAFLDDNAEKTKGWYPSPPEDRFCRSLFLVQKRNTRVPLLEAFDLPDNSVPCAKRGVSTTPPQALMLLNGPLTIQASRAWAERVAGEAGADPAARIERLFALAFQRAPEPDEMEACLRLAESRGLAEVCRALLNVNEFVTVD